MRVFVARETSAIGARLVPQLVARGHDVIGTSRSAAASWAPSERRYSPPPEPAGQVPPNPAPRSIHHRGSPEMKTTVTCAGR